MGNANSAVWLCDLTHTYQTVAANRMPLGAGMIAAYLHEELPGRKDIQVFKFLSDLEAALKKGVPNVLGFSNFVWNSRLNLEVARWVKLLHPEIVIVLGGPHMAASPVEQQQYLAAAPWVDFYFMHEGEPSMLAFMELALEKGFDVEALKEAKPPGAIYMRGDELVTGETLPRIDIATLPSPYLLGLFDPFFKTLKPLVQFTRGCPFSCSYCTEGVKHWTQIYRRDSKVIREELEYIAKRCDASEDLFIADSNFAMYPWDEAVCHSIAEMQDEYGWPMYINVATGKNKKDRVLNNARIIRGALRLSASVQSTDPLVMKNIRRHNISTSAIIDLGKAAGETGANTYSELILALPGDSLRAHFKSLDDVLDSGLKRIVPFTLMLLKGTDLAEEDAKVQYEMLSKYRVLPRCFGSYDMFGEKGVVVAETEEVCVQNSTLPFDDYLKCRSFHLSIELFYNDNILEELYRFIGPLDVTALDFLRAVHSRIQGSPLDHVYDAFLRETRDELWDSHEEVVSFLKEPGIVEKYRDGEFGANLLFKYKTMALSELYTTIYDLSYGAALDAAVAAGRDYERCRVLLEELKKFYSAKNCDFLNTDEERVVNFDYDVVAFVEGRKTLEDVGESPQTIRFFHPVEVRETIELNKGIFGDSLVGRSRLLSQVYVSKCYRSYESV